ncbi:uncharacterized protein LOC144067557 [Stigmatopora argus]
MAGRQLYSRMCSSGSFRVLVLQLLVLLFFGQHVRGASFAPYSTWLQSFPRSSKYASPMDVHVSVQSEGSTDALRPKYFRGFSQQNPKAARPGIRGGYGSSGGLADISPAGIYRLDPKHQPESQSPLNYQEGTIVSSRGIQMMAAAIPRRHQQKLQVLPQSEQKPQMLPRYEPHFKTGWTPPRYEPRPPMDFTSYEKPQDLRPPAYESPVELPMYQPKPSQKYNPLPRAFPRFEPRPSQVLTSQWYEPKLQQSYENPTRVLAQSRYEKLSPASPMYEPKRPRMLEKPKLAVPGYEVKFQQNAFPTWYEAKLPMVPKPRSPNTHLGPTLRVFGSGLYSRQ